MNADRIYMKDVNLFHLSNANVYDKMLYCWG